MEDDLLDRDWHPSSKAAASAVADETVLLHLDSGTYFGLDPLGTRIWQGLQGGQGLRAQIADIATDHHVAAEQVEADVRQFLAELLKHDLVEAR